ncbi:MAG: WecB/TagA/CpsF family glycosyltransferase [Patescibacteria group bacterium]|nr:WecB/TagA/CpsF family glycosyltransferase [Patescibacteria group bacterium]
MFDSIKILGVKISKLDLGSSRLFVSNLLSIGGQHKIFTPNPEMLVDARKDSYFRRVLNSADLNICDGHGIKFLSKKSLSVIHGVDFMLDVCKIAEQKKCSVFFLGSGDKQVLLEMKNRLKIKFPELKIAGSDVGLKVEIQKSGARKMMLKYDEKENEKILQKIKTSKAQILFVAFGHNKQEKWIYENLPKLQNVKLFMGVGGSFDFLSGKVKRAPKLVRKLGLEWLYRLITQPKRFARIFKATITFSFLIILNRRRTVRDLS